jgi:putative transposase
MSTPVEAVALATDRIDDTALKRFRLLRPTLEDGVPITALAETVHIPERTLRRWARRYRAHGMAGLARPPRRDRGIRRSVSADLAAIIEGLALERPRRSAAAIYRIVRDAATRQGMPAPSYATVHAIIGGLDPALMVLAHEGTKVYAQSFELLHRREATRPNEIWQADHTELDILVFDETGAVIRPWLTVIIDDHSRAIAAYRISASAPSALQTALAFRNAIWRKGEAGWTICGIPEVLYTDHGSDFTSRHIEQVCAELKTRLIFSQVGQPRGRGRIERYFGTLNTCCLADLPGYMAPDRTPAKPGMTFAQLDAVLRRFIVETHNHTPHSATGEAPEARWSRGGFLPRMPASLEQLDLLLLTIARPRQVHRDGIRFQSLRYIDATLAAFVGEAVTIRYDPADMAEIRVYRDGEFLCRAVCQELSGETVGLKDIVRARTDRRLALRDRIKNRRSLVDQILVRPSVMIAPIPAAPAATPAAAGAPSLRRYQHE